MERNEPMVMDLGVEGHEELVQYVQVIPPLDEHQEADIIAAFPEASARIHKAQQSIVSRGACIVLNSVETSLVSRPVTAIEDESNQQFVASVMEAAGANTVQNVHTHARRSA